MKSTQISKILCQGSGPVTKDLQPMTRTSPLYFNKLYNYDQVLSKQSPRKESIFIRCRHPSMRALSLRRSLAKGMSSIQPIELNWNNLKTTPRIGVGLDSLTFPNSLVESRKVSCNFHQKQRYDNQLLNQGQPYRGNSVRLNYALQNTSNAKLDDKAKVNNQKPQPFTFTPQTQSEKKQHGTTVRKSANQFEDTIETPTHNPIFERPERFQVSSSNPTDNFSKQLDEQFVEETNNGDQCNNNPTPYGHTMGKQKGARVDIRELPPPLE